ncbi:MAG: (2Fe-2S)-binding protein [Pseudomonadota bacterium]
MFVCICNALRDRELAAAADDAKCVAEVFRKCGRRPQCGKCAPDVAKMIDDARAALQGDGPVAIPAE